MIINHLSGFSPISVINRSGLKLITSIYKLHDIISNPKFIYLPLIANCLKHAIFANSNLFIYAR